VVAFKATFYPVGMVNNGTRQKNGGNRHKPTTAAAGNAVTLIPVPLLPQPPPDKPLDDFVDLLVVIVAAVGHPSPTLAPCRQTDPGGGSGPDSSAYKGGLARGNGGTYARRNSQNNR